MNDQLARDEPPGAPELNWRAERRALSREMHDDIAHSILLMIGNLERIELHQDNWEPAARKLLLDVREVATATFEKVRGLASHLRDRADSQDPALPRGSGDLSTQMSYVLREAIVNALAHAEARQVQVDVKQGLDAITAVVEDDGNGFEPERLAPHEQVGLLSMHERVALIGGRLHIDSARQRGTKVTIYMPCRNASQGGC